MLDHITLHVNDLEKSKEFYLAALKPLGYNLMHSFPEHKIAGFGSNGMPDFWLNGDGAGKPTHIAFMATKKEQVDKFHQAALQAGAKDNGSPGIREQYHENYYGAFVFDPDGNNIEAVTHKPE